jgi:hypothetical protein
MRFSDHFQGCMEMAADAQTVMDYLDSHQGWFRRCAQPMQVQPIGTSGYALTVGRFGAFGFEVEPQIGLKLLPQDDNVYCIETIPIPSTPDQGYDVNFKARLWLVEPESALAPSSLTHVEWELDLAVTVQFPKFIQRLPHSLVQKTGDRLLTQIVRLISHRLTLKVQQDFHTALKRPMHKKCKPKATKR